MQLYAILDSGFRRNDGGGVLERRDAKLTISKAKGQGRAPHLAGSRARQSASLRLAIDVLARVPSSGHPCAFGLARRRPRRRRCGRGQGQRCRRHCRDRLAGRERGGGQRRRRAHDRRAHDRRRRHLQVTFRDNTVLTLSENARVVIDRYVYDPDQGVGDVLLTTTEGAFRFATGKMKTLKEKNITVATPVAEIGVRGTEFWGGPVNAEYNVLLLAGEVNVRNQAGTVILNKPGFATMIRARLVAPCRPSLWSAENIERALTRTVTRQGLKQLERELRGFNIPGLGGGKDRLPDLLKQQDHLPDVLKQKKRKPKIDPGGLERHLLRPQLRLPW